MKKLTQSEKDKIIATLLEITGEYFNDNEILMQIETIIVKNSVSIDVAVDEYLKTKKVVEVQAIEKRMFKTVMLVDEIEEGKEAYNNGLDIAIFKEIKGSYEFNYYDTVEKNFK